MCVLRDMYTQSMLAWVDTRSNESVIIIVIVVIVVIIVVVVVIADTIEGTDGQADAKTISVSTSDTDDEGSEEGKDYHHAWLANFH